MTQKQGLAARQPSRRTIAKGAAWSVPVVAAAASAPLAAASPICEPDIQIDMANSSKCCNGQPKNMKVTFTIRDVNNCLDDNDTTSQICITDVMLSNGGAITEKVWVNDDRCGQDGDSVTVYLLGTANCGVNIDVYYSVDGQAAPEPITLQAGNIPNGNTDAACEPAP